MCCLGLVVLTLGRDQAPLRGLRPIKPPALPEDTYFRPESLEEDRVARRLLNEPGLNLPFPREENVIRRNPSEAFVMKLGLLRNAFLTASNNSDHALCSFMSMTSRVRWSHS